ncbi:MAG: cytochrome c [Flavobacteriales bacterium]|nr:cytochrome c [Flavobacteriales bacterium]MCB9178908.1 cytochrome c [Flavobacteriales bacterium]HPF89452.1 cytochrome c [Flavobacteriales bacterium]
MGIALLVLACGSASGTGGDHMAEEASPGKAVFNMNCTLCHGRDGKAGLNGAKDLTVSTLTTEEMKAIVRNGKGAMAPYKQVLSAQEIEAVVTYIRTLGGAK